MQMQRHIYSHPATEARKALVPKVRAAVRGMEDASGKQTCGGEERKKAQ